MICFKCKKEFVPGDKKQMIAIEVPYLNLFFHRSCYEEIDDIDVFLTQNLDDVLQYIQDISPKNGKKR